MRRRQHNPDQMDLLAWTCPEPVTRFDEIEVRATSFASRIARGVSLAMRDCDLSREQIAAAMSDYLGEDIGKNILDAYAAVSRDDHRISVVRLMALIHVTGDRRLLELVAEQFGWAVIERRYLKLIDIAALSEKEADLRKRRKDLRRQARNDGVMG